jgi:hypothetical protein
MNRGGVTSILGNRNGFYRLCFTMGADIFLGCHCYYKFVVSCPVFRDNLGKLGVRRVCCG